MIFSPEHFEFPYPILHSKLSRSFERKCCVKLHLLAHRFVVNSCFQYKYPLPASRLLLCLENMRPYKTPFVLLLNLNTLQGIQSVLNHACHSCNTNHIFANKLGHCTVTVWACLIHLVLIHNVFNL